MNDNDIFLTKKDLCKMYAAKRKNMEVWEAEELLDSVIKYIKLLVDNKEHYAIRFAHLGALYLKWETEDKEEYINPRYDRMVFDIMKSKGNTKLLKETILQKNYTNMTLDEIQDFQNHKIPV